MAQWLGHSNQKLYQARLLLDELEGLEATASDAFNSALEESVVFQLVLAYQSYLHEVAEIAQYRSAFHSLTELMSLAPVETGEMTELKQLEDDGFSWLAQMLAAFQQCAEKDTLPNQAVHDTSNMIQLHDQTARALPLRAWFSALSNLIDLQRNNRQES